MFHYPTSIRRELDDSYSTKGDEKNCIKRLISCIYDKYFLVTQYKNDVQSLEDYPITDPDDCIRIRITRSSGYVLQINNDGTVSSVIKRIEKKLKQKKKDAKEEREKKNFKVHDEHGTERKIDVDTEPWVLDNDDSTSYCLYHDETETLQLIVGKSTVQIWHQINTKQNDQLLNKGEPFLEYIWTNRIPVKQERNEIRLQIEEFKCGVNDKLHEKLNDFQLKVYWYERKDNNTKKKGHAEMKKEDYERVMNKENEEINKIEQELQEINDNEKMNKGEKEDKKREIIEKSKVKRCEKVIKRKDIIEKFHAIRHACRALEHLNKRHKSNRLANNYIKIHKRLHHLVKFILFGNEEIDEYQNDCTKEKEKRQQEAEIRYIPKDNETIVPKNNMELVIYHCKGRELKETIIIAYFLEDYSRNATDCAGWMCTVSKAIPLLFKCNYDDYARKLFFKECFANQDHFSTHDSNENIPKEYQKRRNHDIKFRAFRLIIKLKYNKVEWHDRWIREPPERFKNYVVTTFENFDNDLGKSPLALLSIVISVVVMSIMLKDFHFSDGFGSVKEIDINLIVGISFSAFLLWIEFILCLRLIPNIGIYIYYSIIIFEAVYPFFLFTLVVILAFAHTMFVLLRNPANINIKDSTYSGNVTNISTHETLFNIELQSNFDAKSSDNPFSTFLSSIVTTYFWISGNMV
ncbi:hypothetical protein RclHR1_17170002 [Rhizophagus clarus]|uniref:Uncharacterized protein n=1 Tax=Rhizophagus clarus TaxID=94130 RepID=A0A2Z6QZZ7_9GLOM|nr:hypothetical protein RclHR1_17170002 [Rhizophagus clarus]